MSNGELLHSLEHRIAGVKKGREEEGNLAAMCESRQYSPPPPAAHRNCQWDSNMKRRCPGPLCQKLSGVGPRQLHFFIFYFFTLPSAPFCTAKDGKTSDPKGYREASRGEAEW